MCLRAIRIKLQRPGEILPGLCNTILIWFIPSPCRKIVPCIGKSGICFDKAGIFSNRHFIVLQAGHKPITADIKPLFTVSFMEQETASEIIIISLRILSRDILNLSYFIVCDDSVQLVSDLHSYITLNTNYISN